MNQQLIEQAIQGKSVIEFTYSNHRRVVEPHVLGIKDGAIQILGYQIGGSSSSGGRLPERQLKGTWLINFVCRLAKRDD